MADGGFVCAFKGRKEAVEQEIAQVNMMTRTQPGERQREWDFRIEPLEVPFLEASRSLCVMQELDKDKE